MRVALVVARLGQSHNGTTATEFHPARLRRAHGKASRYGHYSAIWGRFPEVCVQTKTPPFAAGSGINPRLEERARTRLDATSSGGDALFRFRWLAQHAPGFTSRP